MALQPLGLPISYPGPTQLLGGTTSGGLLDGISEALAAVFKAPVAGSLTAVKFGVEIATTQANPYLVELQGVDAATGLNDLTVKGGGSPVSTTYAAPTTDDQVIVTSTFANAYTCTAQEDLAVVVRNATSSPSSITIFSPNSLGAGTLTGHPYGALAVPTNTITTRMVSMAVVIDGVTYPVGYGWPFVIVATQAFVTGGVVEIGNRFVPQAKMGVVGVWWHGTFAGDIKVHLYDDSTTGSGVELISPAPSTRDKDIKAQAAVGVQSCFFPRVTLTAGGIYYVTIEAMTATSNTMNILRTQASGNANLAFTAGGIQMYRAQRNDNNPITDFTPTLTDQCQVGLWVDAFDDGAGGGGGLQYRANMKGNL
jgi:hypothetical protein